MELHGPTPRTDREYLVQIYSALQNLTDALARLPCTEQSLRVRALEKWRWQFTGGLAILTLLIGVFGSLILNHLLQLIP